MISAPARRMAYSVSHIARASSSMPRAAAALIIAYSPLTWYAASGEPNSCLARRMRSMQGRARLGHRDLTEQIHRGVVVDLAILHDTAVPVVGVLAQAGVPDHEQLRRGALHRSRCLLHDPLLVVRLRAGRVLGCGKAKENDAAEPEPARLLG